MAPEGFKRKLTAILSADAVGYSRLMAEDEAATVKTLATYREVMATLIKQHRGRVVDSPGDNVLAEFSSVVDAVQCAVALQNEFQTRNAELAENRRMEFRIGINLGDVIDEEDRIYGDGVNVAARLEALADPNGICVSKTAFDQIETKLPLGYEYLGEQSVKNIPKPIGAYRVLMKPDAAGKVIGEKRFSGRYSRRIAMATIIILVIVAGGLIGWNIYLHQSKKIEPASVDKMAFPLPDRPSIAVLPFNNIGGDPEQDYIADGFTENIITGLSQIPEMFVIARNSVFTYKGKPVKIKQVSEELGVKYVLEGSIQKAGERLRVNAQLIDALKGNHLWADRYDRELKDLFDLQDEITMKILTALEVKLTRGENANFYKTDNFEAWSHLVKGYNRFDRFTKQDNLKAREHFEQATRLDPDYAAAWTWRAWTHFIEVRLGWSNSPAESIRRSLELSKKSSALAESQASLHSLLNATYMMQGHFDKAIAEGERAIGLAPNDSRKHILLAQTLHFGGRPAEAIFYTKKAMRLEPYYPAWFLPHLAGPYEMVEKYEEALESNEQLLRRALRGEFPPIYVHERLAINYARLDRMEEAQAHAAEILKIKPDYTVEFFRKTTPYKDKAYLENLCDLLLKAGLPE
jgi:adenylate cyclase